MITEAINCPKGVWGEISPYPTVVSVTIHQYTLLGMLLKPCSDPSIRYITVPSMIETIMTASKKTDIFALLAFNALTRLLDSPINRASLRILKTLKSRNALKATKACVPTNSTDTYFGMVERKSTMPKKLKIYLEGLLMVMILKKYSMVNTMVINHSNELNNEEYLSLINETLSNMTSMILARIMMRIITSKDFPAGVSASYIISCSLFFQFLCVLLLFKM